MRVTIRGIRYDSKTALLIGGAEHLEGPKATRWMANLYRTPRRPYRYFLVGAGGGMTAFGMGCASMAETGTRLIPLSVDLAREWATIFLSDFDHEEI
jgi:hypothetical protein